MLREVVNATLESNGMTAYQLVQAAGVPSSTVYRWLAGEGETSTDNIDKILAALRLEVRPVKGARRKRGRS